MFAGISFPWAASSELVTGVLSLPNRAAETEEADVVVNLATPVDLTRSFARLVTDPGSERGTYGGYGWFELVLSASAVTFKYRQLNSNPATSSLTLKAMVYQMLSRPKSIQTVGSTGSNALSPAVNAARALVIPQCGFFLNAVNYNSVYLVSGGASLYVNNTRHPRATVVEWY